MLCIFTGVIVKIPVFSIFICDGCGMKNFDIHFTGTNKPLRMIFVRGTQGSPYLFGEAGKQQQIHVPDFFMSQYTVTQTLVEFVMGRNSDKPAVM